MLGDILPASLNLILEGWEYISSVMLLPDDSPCPIPPLSEFGPTNLQVSFLFPLCQPNIMSAVIQYQPRRTARFVGIALLLQVILRAHSDRV